MFISKIRIVMTDKTFKKRPYFWNCNGRPPRPNISAISCNFLENRRLVPPPGGLAPLPTENPGSAPGLYHFCLFQVLLEFFQNGADLSVISANLGNLINH